MRIILFRGKRVYNGEFAQQFIKENATDDYEIIELHMSSTYGGGR